MAINLGINGFGRIGRMTFRAALTNPDIRIAAINDLTDPETIAYLTIHDSVHGNLDADIQATENGIVVRSEEHTLNSSHYS